MISYEYSKSVVYTYNPGENAMPATTVYMTAADFLASPPTNVHNAARGYIIDWDELDAATRAQIGSKLLMFDKSALKWRAQ